MLKRIITSAVILALTAAGGYAYYWQSRQPAPYAATVVGRQTVEYRFKEEASVRAVDRGVATANVSGPVLSVSLRAGDRVTAGQTVAVIDVTEMQAQVKQLDAQMKNIEAQWRSQQDTARQQIAQLQAQKASGRAVDTADDILAQIALLERELSVDPAQTTGTSRYYRALMEQCDVQIALLSEQIRRGGIFQEAAQDTWIQVTDVPTLRAQLDAKYAEKRALEAQWAGHRDQVETQIAQLNAQLEQTRQAGEVSRDAQDLIDDQIYLLRKVLSEDASSTTANLYRTMLEQTDVQIEELNRQLGGALVVAPMSGVVTRVSAETGGYLQKGAPVVEIVDPSRLEVECQVSTDDAALLGKGMEVVLIWERRDGDVVFPGSILDISPVAVESLSALGLAEQRVRVKIEPSFPAQGGPGEGFGLRAEFLAKRLDDVIALPKTTLTKMDDRDAVWLIRDGALVCVPVTTGLDTDRLIVIEDGLSPGDTVVLDGTDDTLGTGKLAVAQ